MHLINNKKGLVSVLSHVFVSVLACSELVSAGLPQLNLQDPSSIKSVAGQIASDMMHTFYLGPGPGQIQSGIPGIIPTDFQWKAGAMLMSLMNYYYYTGDSTWNDLVTQGMLFQAGPNNDYMTANQTNVMGNDDQGFWGLAAMTAAEQGFPDPPPDQPQWLELAENVFNTQVARWDTTTCDGGLRWQILSVMHGYDYKSSIANGILFNMAARLALYTGNDTYVQWANKVYEWTVNAGYLTPDFNVYDGAHVPTCKDISTIQYTYSLGIYLHGAATMYQQGGSSGTWKQRVLGMLNSSSSVFFSPPGAKDVCCESACESQGTCKDFSFKAYLLRWMAATTKLAPFTRDLIMPQLQATAKAAAAQCVGGTSSSLCGMIWTNNGKWDGSQGVGQQMSVLEAVAGNLVDSAPSIDQKKSSTANPAKVETGPGSFPLPQSSGGSSPSPIPASAAPPAISSVAIACTTCSGGPTFIAAPSSAVSAIQNLASISGVAVAQSAAAQAVSSASAQATQTAAAQTPQHAITSIPIACSTCSGGSTVIAVPSSAASSIESLASASGIAVAQSAAAQAVASAPAVSAASVTWVTSGSSMVAVPVATAGSAAGDSSNGAAAAEGGSGVDQVGALAQSGTPVNNGMEGGSVVTATGGSVGLQTSLYSGGSKQLAVGGLSVILAFVLCLSVQM